MIRLTLMLWLPATALAGMADVDRDGVPEPADQCPNLPEVLNGIDDADGCPDGKFAFTPPHVDGDVKICYGTVRRQLEENLLIVSCTPWAVPSAKVQPPSAKAKAPRQIPLSDTPATIAMVKGSVGWEWAWIRIDHRAPVKRGKVIVPTVKAIKWKD